MPTPDNLNVSGEPYIFGPLEELIDIHFPGGLLINFVWGWSDISYEGSPAFQTSDGSVVVTTTDHTGSTTDSSGCHWTGFENVILPTVVPNLLKPTIPDKQDGFKWLNTKVKPLIDEIAGGTGSVFTGSSLPLQSGLNNITAGNESMFNVATEFPEGGGQKIQTYSESFVVRWRAKVPKTEAELGVKPPKNKTIRFDLKGAVGSVPFADTHNYFATVTIIQIFPDTGDTIITVEGPTRHPSTSTIRSEGSAGPAFGVAVYSGDDYFYDKKTNTIKPVTKNRAQNEIDPGPLSSTFQEQRGLIQNQETVYSAFPTSKVVFEGVFRQYQNKIWPVFWPKSPKAILHTPMPDNFPFGSYGWRVRPLFGTGMANQRHVAFGTAPAL